MSSPWSRLSTCRVGFGLNEPLRAFPTRALHTPHHMKSPLRPIHSALTDFKASDRQMLANG